MKLPGADGAVVDAIKVRDYLLARDHPIGRAKSRFFVALGFRQEHWIELRSALLAVAGAGDAVLGETNPFGQTYRVSGILRGPGGREAYVVTVWIILRGEDFPRFVTAYPGGPV